MSDLYTREVDIHGMTVIEARRYLKQTLSGLPKHIKEVRVIHGCNRGRELQKFVRTGFSHKRLKGKLLELNQGMTTLIIKE